MYATPYPAATMDGLLAIGLAAGIGRLSWSLVEYTIHGVLSHRLRTFVSPLHWSHHRTPEAVFTSPLAWVPAAAAIFALSVAIAGLAVGAPFILGLLAGFLHYEHVHWRIHFRVPRSARQERLRAHHLAHHFVNPNAYHGVTTRFWDHVFRTLPRGWESEYARGAARPPIAGPSNLRASCERRKHRISATFSLRTSSTYMSTPAATSSPRAADLRHFRRSRERAPG